MNKESLTFQGWEGVKNETLFVKRCKVCRKRLNGEYILSESYVKQVHVCKKCFDSHDVRERYFNVMKK